MRKLVPALRCGIVSWEVFAVVFVVSASEVDGDEAWNAVLVLGCGMVGEGLDVARDGVVNRFGRA